VDDTPPSDVIDLAGPISGWELQDPTNPGPDRCWLTEDHAIKAVPSVEQARLANEAANSRWLSAHVPTAAPLLESVDAERAWLVSNRLAGFPAHRPDLHGDVGSLAELAGRALRAIHAISIDEAPASWPRGWDAVEATADATVASGIDDVDEPYRRYSPDKLLTMWRDGRPDSEDLVVCHGDPSLPNLIARHGELSGWVDLGAMRIADRHLDLAHAHASVHRNLGPEAVYVFYDAYGRDANLIHLDHYLLAKQLLP
jgi:aminoglycoside phosphotransferase